MASADESRDTVLIADLNLRRAGSSMDALAAKIVSVLRDGTVQLVDLAQGVAATTSIRAVGLRAVTGDTGRDGAEDG